MIKKLLSTALLLSILGQLECKRSTKSTTLINKSQESFLETKQAPAAEANVKVSWPEICTKYKNSVVQIYSYVNVFNLANPSKTGNKQYVICGTGFFISEDGYLLTNFHVIKEAPVVELRLPSAGDKGFEAENLGCYPEKDIALLKIKKSSLENLKKLLNIDKITPFELGDSDKLSEAQKVMCLGYPLGQKNLKISIGNISGRESMGTIGECAQTTTPINHGNSGGPFLNENGKVVGIATLKFENTDGIGYFIPINTVKTVLEDLQTKKILKKIQLGLSIQPTTEETLNYLGNPTDGGVYVFEVEAKSLAETSGLQKGDVIYEIDGFKIDRYGFISPSWREAKISIYDYIFQLKMGSNVSLTVYRNGKKLLIQAQLEDNDAFAIKEFHPWLEEAPDFERIGGIVVSQFTLNHLQQFINNDCCTKKMLKYTKPKHKLEPRIAISCVYPGSVALNYQLQDFNSIISKVNDIEVRTVQDFRDAVLKGNVQNSAYLTIETEDGCFAAIPLIDLVNEESMISQTNYLPESNLVNQLIQKYTDSENQYQ